MRKLKYSPRTLDDQIIKDGLCAVAALADNPLSRDKYFVVGGIATQSYLPTSCRRKTSDIDLAVLVNLSKAEFKSFSRTASEYLQDNGYTVGYKKTQNSHCLEYSTKNGEASIIEFPRFTEKRFERMIKILTREKENSRNKIIEGTVVEYVVSSPEDIIIPKLVRCVNSLARNPEFEHYVSKRERLSLEKIREILKHIDQLREEVTLDPTNPKKIELLRFISDLYDIRLLSELGGINPSYFQRAMQDWETLRDDINEDNFDRQSYKSFIFRATLPIEMMEVNV